jgi:predicted RNase H-like HicB family nuclease
MELTAVLTPAEEGGFVALNPETGTTTQGETVEEAVANLKQATAMYLSEFSLPATGHPFVTVFTVPEPSFERTASGALRAPPAAAQLLLQGLSPLSSE